VINARGDRMSLRAVIAVGTCVISLAASLALAADAPQHSLRMGLPSIAETLDPARAIDLMENWVTAAIYDTLYVLDPLAVPTAIVPFAAKELPEVSADYRTLLVRVRSGIYFTSHPSFGGKPRELTAADFAYAIKRILDPAIHSPSLYLFEGKIDGLDALARRAKELGRALDYDAPVAGLVVVDRWTLRIHLNAPDPVFPFLLALPVTGGVAREVVQAEGGAYGQKPVGSGAFIVERFTPGQRVSLTRNQAFRTVHWEDMITPASRAAHRGHPMNGRVLPGFDRIEISTTVEFSTQLLALRNRELDLIYGYSPAITTANGELNAEALADGLRLVREPAPMIPFWSFNMRDPVLGGDTKEKIALRRAIAMAFDDDEQIRASRGFDSLRQQFVPPGIEGYIRDYSNPNRFDPTAANALLDRFGYKRGANGYRQNPDGSNLTVSRLSGSSASDRRTAEFTKRMLDRIAIRVTFDAVPGNDFTKRMTQCQYGMAVMPFVLDFPDGMNAMSWFYSKGVGSVNLSCFSDPVFDAAYEKALVMSPGPGRTELFRAMQTRLDFLAPARPLPSSDAIVLKRANILGPFGTFNDFIQLLTLSPVSSDSVRSVR